MLISAHPSSLDRTIFSPLAVPSRRRRLGSCMLNAIEFMICRLYDANEEGVIVQNVFKNLLTLSTDVAIM